jgi:hypothetical protein
MSISETNNVVTEIAPCGLLCLQCRLYQAKICQGCYNENQKLDEKCPVTGEVPFEESLHLITCMNEKGVDKCEDCTEFPECSIYEAMLIKCPFSRPVHELKEGLTYLIKEKKPDFSFLIFTDMLRHGSKGLCISRQHPKNLKDRPNWKDVQIFWLTTIEGDNNINPTDLGILSEVISNFLGEQVLNECVVLLEGLELLFTHNDFPKVLRMVNHTTEQVMHENGRLILSIDERTLDKKELALLERNMEILEEKISPLKGML